MFQAILKDARRRLVRRGFEDRKAEERVIAILMSLVVMKRDGEVIDGAAEAMELGIEVPESRR